MNNQLLKKLNALIHRQQFTSDLDEEMAFHRGQKERELVAGGMSADEAHYAAMREFGNAALLKERSAEVAGFRFETTLQDLRYAVRQLRKNPGFAATAIFVLALGICASVSIFAFVDAALIQPLPYPDPNSLVAVTESVAMIPRADLSYLDYLDWKRMNTVFRSFDVYTGEGYLMRTPSGLETVRGARVSDGFFRTLGVRPSLGRDFYQGEDLPSAPGTVILSYGSWKRRFGGNSDVIGKKITLGDELYTIVGVLPQTFEFAPRGDAELWTTLRPQPKYCELRRSCHDLDGIARLKPGVSVMAALADVTKIAKVLESEYPDSNRGQGATLEPFSQRITGDIRPILLVLLGGAGLLLLIACVNVASLLLVRSESRKREIAVRGALGASRARLWQQFMIESLALAFAASVIGVLCASWAMRLLLLLIPKDMLAGMPYLQGIGIHAHVIAFAAGIFVLATALLSLTPIARLKFSEMREGLAEGTRGSAGTLWRRLGSQLVAVELALAVVLLVSAGLVGKSLHRLLHVDLGFQPDHLALMRVAHLSPVKEPSDPQLIEFARKVLDSVSSLPGVKSAAIASVVPVSFNGNTTWVRFVGRPYNGQHNEVNERDVSAGYFSKIRAKLLRGRYFVDSEDESKPRVAIINEAFAKLYFPGEDPVGKQMGDTDLSPKSITEIVGVVDDVREGPLDAKIWPAVYYPFNQSPNGGFSVIVRTSQAPGAALPSLVAAVRKVDRDTGIFNLATMEEHVNTSPSAYLHRSSAWLVGGFAGLALLLGIIGLYGVIAYSVSRRTREIGVRMALGAQRKSVYRLVLREAGLLTILGIGVGLLCSLLTARLLGSMLFGVRPWDVTTLLGVSAVLAAAALLASFLPARRAASVDPVEALRTE
ncbi:MAG TPA: ABC transporter permease [Terriglobales bacterium]|nr:ABC transporter permease [Terriglobales bacterium]